MHTSPLWSSQREVEARVMPHSMHRVQNVDMDQVITHANDTDVIVMRVYFAATLLKDLPELWIRTAQESFLRFVRLLLLWNLQEVENYTLFTV